MDIYYENSEGRKLNLSKWPIGIEDETALFGKKWNYTVTDNTVENRADVKNFYRTSATFKVILQIFADSEEEFFAIVNEIEEMSETDIENKTPGKIWYEDYYLECFFTESTPKEYDPDFYTIDDQITVLTTRPFWVKEKRIEIKKQEIKNTKNKKYPNKYLCRYGGGLSNRYVINENFKKSNFKMIIYGAVVNPMVKIGENTYIINTILEEGEYLEIDTIKRSIIKVMKCGERINAFHSRQKKGFFKKIQPGRNAIIWPGTFDFDLIIYEERSRPK